MTDSRLKRACVRASAALVGLAAVGAGLVVSSGSARAAEEIHYPVSGQFVLSGLGDGHGHGMSQWGAEGAAITGLSAAQILKFYYPTTTVGSMGNVALRVLLSGVPSGVLEIQETTRDGTAMVAAAADGASLTLPAVISGAPVGYWRAVQSGGVMVLQGDWAGGWHNFSATGSPWTSTSISFTGTATNKVAVERSANDIRDYRGTVSVSVVGSATDVIDDVTMQDYLQGVVPSESPSSWLPAALESQAVAARTYADQEINPARNYDICDNTECQEYRGASDYNAAGALISQNEAASTNAVITASAGEILTYQGAPAFTQYAAADGGWTLAGSEPYLPSQADPYDGVVPNAAHSWTTTVSAASVGATFGVGTATAIVINSRDGDGTWGGRIVSLTVQGTTGSAAVAGTTFAADMGLESTWWTAPTGNSSINQLTATNLYLINSNPGDGHLDLHMLTAASRYNTWALHVETALPDEPVADWKFFIAPYNGDKEPDLYAVCLVGCHSGDVEVHVLTAASYYQTYAAHIATSIPDFAANSGEQVSLGQFQDDGQEDLYLIQTAGTSSGKVQLTALSGAAGYHAALMSNLAVDLSDVGPNAGQWQFMVGDPAGHGDLVSVHFAGNTQSGHTEVHVLSQASNYQTFTAHDVSAFPLNETSPQFALGSWAGDGQADLYAMLPEGSSGHTEVHVLGAGSRYGVYLAHIATLMGHTPPSSWALALG